MLCLERFLVLKSLLIYLKENGLVNLLSEECIAIGKQMIIHEGWTLDEQRITHTKAMLNSDNVYLDKNNFNIRDNTDKIIYEALELPKEYTTWGQKYLCNRIYPTQELISLVKDDFVTYEEKQLEIARKSLDVTNTSIRIADKTLRSTRLAIYVSIIIFVFGIIFNKCTKDDNCKHLTNNAIDTLATGITDSAKAFDIKK